MSRKHRYHLVTGLVLGACLTPRLGHVQAQETAAGASSVQPPLAAESAAPEWPSPFFKSLKFSGYLESSYTWNAQRPRNVVGNENRGRIFDVNHNEFMLNAFELTVERPADADNIVGFKVTPFAGQDAASTQAIGLFKAEDGTSDTDFDLLNAFISGYCPGTGTTLKLGKFETTAGAEVIHGPYNDNFSRSFLFGFAIPFTHTGLLATQPLLKQGDGTTDLMTLSAGVVNGWDNVKDLNESKMLLTNATLTPSDAFSLGGNFFWSGSEVADNNSNDRVLLDLVGTVYPVAGAKDLKLLVNFDVGGEEGADADGSGYAQWYGVSGIVRYDFALASSEDKKWFVALRAEWFDDDDGSRLAAPIAGLTTDVTAYELTFTLGYKPWESLLVRGEVRYDKADENIFFHEEGIDTDADGVGDTGDENHQFTFALEAAFLF